MCILKQIPVKTWGLRYKNKKHYTNLKTGIQNSHHPFSLEMFNISQQNYLLSSKNLESYFDLPLSKMPPHVFLLDDRRKWWWMGKNNTGLHGCVGLKHCWPLVLLWAYINSLTFSLNAKYPLHVLHIIQYHKSWGRNSYLHCEISQIQRYDIRPMRYGELCSNIPRGEVPNIA